MTENRSNFANLVIACWKDASMRKRLQEEPSVVLAEFDLEVPAGVQIEVVENSDSVVYITLPKAPGNAAALSDEELMQAAGGCCGSVVAIHAPSN